VSSADLRAVLDRAWWPVPAEDDARPDVPSGGEGLRAHRRSSRLHVEVSPAATPGDLEALLRRARPDLGDAVEHVVLDLHRVSDRDVALARALDRLRVRLLVRGVGVEVVHAPPGLAAQCGDGRTVRYRVNEDAS
jgi:hypothetical protein